MTLFSGIEYHDNPYSERHGQNVVHVREFRKNRSWEDYTFLTGVNFSMCRENVWYLQSRERLGEILVLHQGVHGLHRSYRQHYKIQLCINIYVLRYSNYKDCICALCNVMTTESLKVLYKAQQLFPHLVVF